MMKRLWSNVLGVFFLASASAASAADVTGTYTLPGSIGATTFLDASPPGGFPAGATLKSLTLQLTSFVSGGGTIVEDVAVAIAPAALTNSNAVVYTSNTGGYFFSGQSTAWAPGSFPAVGVNTITFATPPALSGNKLYLGNAFPSAGTWTGTLTYVYSTAAAQLSVSNTADRASAVAGSTVVYTVAVTNSAALAADGTAIADPLPSGVSGFSTTCAATGGAVCPNGAGPTAGPLNETIATLPASGSLTYTITATLDPGATGSVVNNATITPPTGGECAASVCSASATTTVTAAPQVSVNSTADPANPLPGAALAFSIVLSNTGAVDAGGTTIASADPAGLTNIVKSCTATGGAVCPGNDPNATVATFPAGGQLTWSIAGSVASPNPPASISNSVTVNPPPSGTCGPGATAPPCTSSASVTVASVPAPPPPVPPTPTPTPSVVTPVPIDEGWMLSLLGLLLGGGGALAASRRRGKHRE